MVSQKFIFLTFLLYTDRYFYIIYTFYLGANGLANARDFLTPVAAFDKDYIPADGFQMISKYQGKLFKAMQVCINLGNLRSYSFCIC